MKNLKNSLCYLGIVSIFLWLISLSPFALKIRAKNDFNNLVLKENNINIKCFKGPFKINYNTYKWVFNDKIYISVQIDCLFFGLYDAVYYYSSDNSNALVEIRYGCGSNQKTEKHNNP